MRLSLALFSNILLAVPSLQEYFNDLDYKTADCIPQEKLGSYEYLGDVSWDIRGRNCSVWIDATEPYRRSENVDLAAYSLHNKCRLVNAVNFTKIRYELGDKDSILRGKMGPWCFSPLPRRIDFPYTAEVCFPICKKYSNYREKKKKRTSYGIAFPLINYNQALLDPIERYFKYYEWGDPTYYTWKPSQDQLSAEYFRIRNQLFYGAVVSLVLIISWIVVCFNLRRRALSSRIRREKAIESLFKQKQPLLQGVLSRPAPN